MDYDYVLFDLGGVLVELTGVSAMQRLAGLDDEEEVWRRWLGCEWVRSFERGKRMAAWDLGALFDVRFLSYEMGLVKPDREVFEYVAGTLGTPAGRIVFLDDNSLNVEQAAAAGFASRRVSGVEEARAALVELGVLA